MKKKAISLKKEAKKYEDYINAQKKNKKFLQEYEEEELRTEYENQVKKMSESAKKSGIITEEDINGVVHECREERRNKKNNS